MWDHRKHFVNTALQLNDAHGFGEPITGVQFGYDNRMLATRSNDSTLKLWDIRNFKKAVNVAEDLYSTLDLNVCDYTCDVTCTFFVAPTVQHLPTTYSMSQIILRIAFSKA